VQQQEVDVVGAELAQRILRRALEPCRLEVVEPDLGREPDVGAVDSAGRDPLADLSLVLVRPRGVDVPVADLERIADALARVLAGDQPGAEAEPRDLGALDRELGRISSHVRHASEATPIAAADTFRGRC
jgi:hypothetical protein